MHRTTTEQKTTFEDRLEKLAEAQRPTLDKLSTLSGDINGLNTRLTGELRMLRSQIQAIFLVAGSIVAVLGLVASVTGNASAIPAGYYQFGQAVFQVFLVGLAIILLRATWLFVETRQWKTRRKEKGSRGHMRVSGQIWFRVYIASYCHQCVHLQTSRSCSSCTGIERRYTVGALLARRRWEPTNGSRRSKTILFLIT